MAQDPLSEGARAALLRDLDATLAEFMGIAATLDLRPSPGWGPYEVLAHVAGWHLSAAARLRQVARDEEPTPPGPTDALNAAFVVERAAIGAEALVAEVRSSFEALRAAVEALPESEFWRGAPGEEDSLCYFIAHANGPGHYREHLEDLQR